MFMRLKKNKRKNPVAGSVLLVTLATCLILGVLMGSYLSMIKSQHFSVARGQAWNSALAVAEPAAGAVCKYFPFHPNPIPATWASGVVSIDWKE